MFLIYDIMNFISWFFNLMLSGVINSFNILGSFVIAPNISLLDFCIALVLIPAGLQILLATIKTGKLIGRAERRRKE